MPNGNVPHEDMPIEGMPNNVMIDEDAPNESPGNHIPTVGVVLYKLVIHEEIKYHTHTAAGVWYYKILDSNLHEPPDPTPTEPNLATPNLPNEDPENANLVNKDPISIVSLATIAQEDQPLAVLLGCMGAPGGHPV
ncbi:hypothetical protein BS47DRAFT_1358435 [Hydnum rufescens UP504]|uniref:Uncharacterized protein n=1 Tax=Hydnum rufescens UP504 TaxID=1448309 RepID=A0A9P6DY19_9AGAM|nr:hypothetical protein BS47DRAFT_1358435 [Hydnum rufescens UP504]